MNLFSQIQSLQLLIFYKDEQEIVAILDYVFFYNIIKINHFLYFLIILILLAFSFIHIKSLLIPCAYVSIESIDSNLLSSFELNEILLVSSVKTVCLSLLNLCCVFKISLLFINFFYPL